MNFLYMSEYYTESTLYNSGADTLQDLCNMGSSLN